MAIAITQSGHYSLSMDAGAGSSSGEGLGFQINQTNGPITAGTYSETAGGADYVIAGTYNPGTTDVSAIYGAGLNPAPSTPLQIVISGISDKQVSGTFSGTFYDNSGTGTNSLSITNGSFNLPIQ